MNRRRTLYWDSCVFIALLAQEPAHFAAISALRQAWDDGTIDVVTSALTITEVLMAKCGPPGTPAVRLGPAVEPAVLQMLDASRLQVVELTVSLAREARQLVWKHSIRPKDAIHVASAIAAGVDAMHTTDGELLRASGLIGLPTPLTISIPMKDPA